MTSENGQNRSQPKAGWYVIAIFDLLGQQDNLRRLTKLPDPNNSVEIGKFNKIIKDLYAPYYTIRKLFTDAVDAFQTGGLDISTLSADQQMLLKKIRSTPISIRHFSDSTIINIPLDRDSSPCPCRAIYGVLVAAAQTMIACLAKKMPIRGGIDVGIAINFDANEIYGPALARAHVLESKIAQYPRIVIGETLYHYLQTTKSISAVDAESDANSKMALTASELLVADDDGQLILDYLGTHFRDRLHESSGQRVIIHEAYKFIIEQSDKYQKDRNSKLGFRYTLIRNYFENRLPLWGFTLE